VNEWAVAVIPLNRCGATAHSRPPEPRRGVPVWEVVRRWRR